MHRNPNVTFPSYFANWLDRLAPRVSIPEKFHEEALEVLEEALEAASYPAQEIDIELFGEDDVEISTVLLATSVNSDELDTLIDLLRDQTCVSQAFWSPSTAEEARRNRNARLHTEWQPWEITTDGAPFSVYARSNASKHRRASSWIPGHLLSRGPATFRIAMRPSFSHFLNRAISIPSSSATIRHGLPSSRARSAVNAVPPSNTPRFRIKVPSESSMLRRVRVS